MFTYSQTSQGRRKQICLGPADQNLRNMTLCQIFVLTSIYGRGWPSKVLQRCRRPSLVRRPRLLPAHAAVSAYTCYILERSEYEQSPALTPFG